jgi:hypothetical protein
MFYNLHHLRQSNNELWARMFQTSFCRSLVLSSLALGKLDHFSLSSLIKIIHIQSIHALVILISSCFRHQPQSSLVWLLLATFNVWFASLPLRVFRPNLGTRFFLGGEAVTVRVPVMLGIYFVSVKYVFVCIKLMCVFVWSFENLKCK